jgi:hypothetical protein
MFLFLIPVVLEDRPQFFVLAGVNALVVPVDCLQAVRLNLLHASWCTRDLWFFRYFRADGTQFPAGNIKMCSLHCGGSGEDFCGGAFVLIESLICI